MFVVGDEVEKFEGILLGLFFFIFGKLEEGLSFLEVILFVKEKGFIEFDLCDDLLGVDVVCKLLIFVCEMGLVFEFEDIEVEGVLLKGFLEGMNKEEFL